jgi:hypothetical protein
MTIICNNDIGMVQIYNDDINTYNCTFDGEVLPIPNRIDNAYLICPRLAMVCPELYTCPYGCYGEGVCVNIPTSGQPQNRPYCVCYNETNHDPSCAPSIFVIHEQENSPSISISTTTPSEPFTSPPSESKTGLPITTVPYIAQPIESETTLPIVTAVPTINFNVGGGSSNSSSSKAEMRIPTSWSFHAWIGLMIFMMIVRPCC